MLLNNKQIKLYKNFNVVILILCLFFILMPAVTYIIKLIIPEIYDLFRCNYYRLTKNPCPFCGITTDLKNIISGDIGEYRYNILSFPLLLCGISELIFRIRLILHSTKIKITVIYKDIILHSLLFVILIVYCILFFKLNLARF